MKYGNIQLNNAKIENSDGYIKLSDNSYPTGTLLSNLSSGTKLTRKSIDANDLIVYRFYESTAPFTNLGNTGEAQNLNQTTAGNYAGGINGSLYFDNGGLSYNHLAQDSTVLSAANFSWTSSEITVMIMVTITRPYGASNIGKIFWKSYYDSWTDPYYGFLIQSEPNKIYTTINTSIGFPHGAIGRALPLLNEPTQIGITYDGQKYKMFYNGKSLYELNHVALLDMGTGPYLIGGVPFGVNSQENAGFTLEEVRVCDTARDEVWFSSFYS